jgi:CheY-like chemotaxis protein
MNTPSSASEPRILIVDDNPSIHEDFRKILGSKTSSSLRFEDAESALFGTDAAPAERAGFQIDSAFQGQEGLTLVEKALGDNDPYVLAFVDVRMPPGWDGVETLNRIWQCAPELQAVICTAYSDYSWDEMTRRLGQKDNLLILKKPFETVEVLQMANALAQKWVLAGQAKLRHQELEAMVEQRTRELTQTVSKLQEALDNIKTLSGLIPICASCKRIRDDQGFWNQVEAYVSKRTTAKFTHGMCPDCSKTFLAELENVRPYVDLDG